MKKGKILAFLILKIFNFNMVKNLIIYLFLLFYVVIPLSADNCENPKNDFDGLYCLNKLYVVADKDLNDSYKKLVGKLDSSMKNTLKISQRRWIESRNNECSWKDERGFYVNMQCATNKTVDRKNFLDERIRECIASGCQAGKLSD